MVDRKVLAHLPADTLPPVVLEILLEQQRGLEKFGGEDNDDTHACTDWERYIMRFASTSSDSFRDRMIQIAALAISAIESNDRIASRNPFSVPEREIFSND